jgi:predicted  nucleic acid-binding Zn-ribbon protein
LSTLKRVREKNEELEAKCNQLNVLIETLEKREQSNNVELQRLRFCEAAMNSSNEANVLKEKTILDLIAQNKELEARRKELSDQLVRKKVEYEECIEQLSGESAMHQNERNALQAQLNNLNEEYTISLKDLTDEVRYKYKF